jgi:nucleotide sugar dehydrogenase
MIIEVIGYKGVVGNATYQWLKAMHPSHQIIGRDRGDSLPKKADVSFVCVPEAMVQFVCTEAAFYSDVLVVRSTVHPGTCRHIQTMVEKHVCHNPEFLRQATAVQDVFNQSYVLIGSCCQKHGEIVRRLYEPARVEIVMTNTITSELVKIATNNYLACLVSFWNEIDDICEASGIPGHRVGAIATLDPRVVGYGARYHHQFGGKCLPKELEQMIIYARDKGVKTPMLWAIKEVNLWQVS